jgi:hypothetical protein
MVDPKVVPLRASDKCVVCGQPCEARCAEHAYDPTKMPRSLPELWRIGLLLLSGTACIAYGGILVFILYKATPDPGHATFSGVLLIVMFATVFSFWRGWAHPPRQPDQVVRHEHVHRRAWFL